MIGCSVQRVVKQKRQRAELDESCAGGGTVGTWDTGVAEGDPRNVMLEHSTSSVWDALRTATCPPASIAASSSLTAVALSNGTTCDAGSRERAASSKRDTS